MATDKAHGFFKWLDYNRFLVAGALLAILLAVLLASCTPKTTSLLNPPAQVTDAQLQSELVTIQTDYDAMIQKAEIAKADLEQQYATRAKIVEIVGGVVNLAASGGLNPATGAAAGLQLLTLLGGIGLLLDNRRKDSVIAQAKAKTK